MCLQVLLLPCRSPIDKADMDMIMTLLWRLEATKQAAVHSEARVASFLNLEYMFLQYCSGVDMSLRLGVCSAVEYDNFAALLTHTLTFDNFDVCKVWVSNAAKLSYSTAEQTSRNCSVKVPTA